MPVRGKRHYHYVVAYETRGKTRQGNPETYIFTLECGHKKLQFHSARVQVLTFILSVIIPDLIKKRKKLKKEVFPRVQCYECARGKPHTKDATDLDELIKEINSKIAKD